MYAVYTSVDYKKNIISSNISVNGIFNRQLYVQ